MEIISRSARETMNLGKTIAGHMQRGDIICLFGEFGAGKTVLAKGIAAGMGLRENMVISPSFVLARQYCTRSMPLYHLDLYRLNSPEDIFSLGYEEYLYGDGITIIEWADRLKYLLPDEYLKIRLFIRDDAKRAVRLSSSGSRYRRLLDRLDEDIRH